MSKFSKFTVGLSLDLLHILREVIDHIHLYTRRIAQSKAGTVVTLKEFSLFLSIIVVHILDFGRLFSEACFLIRKKAPFLSLMH